MHYNPFNQFMNSGSVSQDAFTKLAIRVEKLEAENRQHKENFKRVNELLKECIRRIENG